MSHALSHPAARVRYALAHLSDRTLVDDLKSLAARERVLTAEFLAHLAEVDARRLYVPAAYPSLYAYCVGELALSEDAACKRVRAARAARQFPALFEALAQGRLHLSTVVLLAPHLTPQNVTELLESAAGRSKAEVEQLLAARYPRPDLPARVAAVPEPPPALQVVESASAPGRITPPAPTPRVAPLAPERFALQVTIDGETHEALRYAQALLGHQVPCGEVAAVLKRALLGLVEQLERRKFAAARRPQGDAQRPTANPRHVPAAVRRAVWERDQGCCTFVSATGRRCAGRTRLEYDHVEPVARGGQPSAANLRLRCRAHNQYAAEQAFGTAFMRAKREAAREASQAREANQARSEPATRAPRASLSAPGRMHFQGVTPSAPVRGPAGRLSPEPDRDVTPWLRALGVRAADARRAAARCEAMPDATLEERVRCALQSLAPPHVRRPAPGVDAPA